jgi:hypothetical protein
MERKEFIYMIISLREFEINIHISVLKGFCYGFIDREGNDG